MYAKARIPKRIQPKRWARNASIPDAWPIRQSADALNHLAAYGRKVFLNARAPWDSMVLGAGPTTVWRAAMRTGLAVSELRISVLLGPKLSALGPFPDTRLEIDVTEVGGSTQTEEMHYGAIAGVAADAPNLISRRIARFDVDPSTVYEIAIRSYDGARPLSVCGFEWADPEIDEARSPFVELAPSVFQPITDEIREKLLGGASDYWLENGAHLLTWPGLGTGSARTITSTTYTNVHDGSSTTTSAATPGYRFGAEGAGDGAVTSLQPWCRLKDGDDLPVTLAVYADTTSAAATGAVALLDSAGNGPSIGSIDSSGPKWWYANTTWSNVAAIAGSGKVDLKGRNTTGGQSISIEGFSMWTREV